MGFLDHASNNIILDAVLTDVGRQFLARNDGSFSIFKFALGDDEVDYSIVRKYGRTVGKEKIEKNTPVFEALTNQNFAQKYRLISVSNPNLVRLPNLTLTADKIDATTNVITLGSNNSKTARVTVSQKIKNETSIDPDLKDQTFIVEMNNLFLRLEQKTPDNIDGQQRAVYILTLQGLESDQGGTQVQFSLSTKNITPAQFVVFGNISNKNLIKTQVKVTGVQSGAVLEFQVNINQR